MTALEIKRPFHLRRTRTRCAELRGRGAGLSTSGQTYLSTRPRHTRSWDTRARQHLTGICQCTVCVSLHFSGPPARAGSAVRAWGCLFRFIILSLASSRVAGTQESRLWDGCTHDRNLPMKGEPGCIRSSGEEGATATQWPLPSVLPCAAASHNKELINYPAQNAGSAEVEKSWFN